MTEIDPYRVVHDLFPGFMKFHIQVEIDALLEEVVDGKSSLMAAWRRSIQQREAQ
jgi:hypothetical protein